MYEVWEILCPHNVFDCVLILNEGDNPHLRLTLGALKWIYLASAFNAGDPSTLTELTAIVSLWLAL